MADFAIIKLHPSGILETDSAVVTVSALSGFSQAPPSSATADVRDQNNNAASTTKYRNILLKPNLATVNKVYLALNANGRVEFNRSW